MSLRYTKVNELPVWNIGSKQSTRQSDNSSCGLYVLLVSVFFLDCFEAVLRLNLPVFVNWIGCAIPPLKAWKMMMMMMTVVHAQIKSG